jgi:hypothetical protein
MFAANRSGVPGLEEVFHPAGLAGPEFSPEERRFGARRALAEPVNDTRLLEIVWGHLKLHPIAIEEADETLAHFA